MTAPMPEEKETGRLEAFSDGVFAIASSVGLCLALAVFFAFRGGAPERA